ncbi:ankyrin repeat-containing domain protein [Microdochium trichocladiopsis]|uniref:Ankyrin repeat-containing domain protein n=1 Tax=Microdochium trichocladiopsis TaxID=1682393 RepID=A0A9P9BPH7_9PEZI|nr:ankyrin repeat-containing domain protein [Microdochium trichocladiopsis]KAH7029274.1 ankyrin repeat-containing domain protein [Microdochium trichocladiopsis]
MASSKPGASDPIPPQVIELASRMYDAARSGNTLLLEQALAAGLPPNLTNDRGDSLLMLAAYHGHADLVQLLIQHGADPNRINDKGQSPLAGAVFKNEDAVIECLLAGGADPDHGRPSALQCLDMFKLEDKWLEKFQQAKGKGKAARTPSPL